MKKLKELCGKNSLRTFLPSDVFVLNDTLIGIELELENINLATKDLMPDSYNRAAGKDFSCHGFMAFFNSPSKLWMLADDGSLRNNGREFVSLPLLGQDILVALQDLSFINKRFNPETSETCSTHIHMNVMDLSSDELIYLLCLYCIFEKLIFKYVGEDRENNFYCMPYYASNSLVRDLGHLVAFFKQDTITPEDISRKLEKMQKYTAVNIKPIFSNETIEFRHLYATLDPKQLVTWINILFSLKKYSLGKSPLDLPEFYSSCGAGDFGVRVFGDLFYTLTSGQSSEFVKQSMLEGVRYAQNVLRLHNVAQEYYEELRQKIVKKELTTHTSLLKYYSSKTGSSKSEIIKKLDSTMLQYLAEVYIFDPGFIPKTTRHRLGALFNPVPRPQVLSTDEMLRHTLTVTTVPIIDFNTHPNIFGDDPRNDQEVPEVPEEERGMRLPRPARRRDPNF